MHIYLAYIFVGIIMATCWLHLEATQNSAIIKDSCLVYPARVLLQHDDWNRHVYIVVADVMALSDVQLKKEEFILVQTMHSHEAYAHALQFTNMTIRACWYFPN